MASNLASQPKWILLAIASGTFAALNGLFAKLYVQHLIPSSPPFPGTAMDKKTRAIACHLKL